MQLCEGGSCATTQSRQAQRLHQKDEVEPTELKFQNWTDKRTIVSYFGMNKGVSGF